ncbi:unnamed protein product [Nippostrongylus brasiliensis]|uniref:Phlebovirus_G2 domain-containing protein n=1 Tax=Nippostrongylus brasiliensis TaxID=27835 RepID=A0A0N4YE67_NIPBR|nr:unnamed protein product [Nippostrongylus brasiliensis]
MRTNCRCQPAESTVNCLCADANITADFRTELQHRLPIQRPWIRYEELQRGQQDVTVLAVIPSLSTAELLFKINEEFDSSIKEVTDSICKIKDSTLEGCYHCAKGALASITCHSQELPTMATVTCDQETFTVPCDAEGKESTLHFSFTRAQVKVHCTTSCGQTKTHFELTGVLHWTNTIYSTAQRLLERDTNVYNEITLPDVGHIFSVMKSWYKFSLAVTGLLLICIATGYLLFWSCGLQVIVILCRIIWRCAVNAVQLAFRLALRAILALRISKNSHSPNVSTQQ